MRIILPLLFFANITHAQQQAKNSQYGFADAALFQLADPSLASSAIFFEKVNSIQSSLAYDNVTLRYTLDGSEPNEESPIYTEPILVNKSGEFKVKAFHPICRNSNTVGIKYFKINKKAPVKSIYLTTPPNENYPGIGAAGLVDLKKGSNNFRGDEWMGFNGNDVEIFIEMEEHFQFEKITASTLCNPDSWIFPPAAIEVFISNNGDDYYNIAEKEFNLPKKDMPSGQQFFDIHFPKTGSQFLKILIKNIPAIPDWHLGKGNPAWLFIDEILIQ